MKISFARVLLIITLLFVSLLAVSILWFTKYDWVRWPASAQEDLRCYSPNGEYYILRYQSLFSALLPQRQARGTAKLYNKNGKFLSSGKTVLDLEFGPIWGGSTVGYFDSSPDWDYKTPTPTGTSTLNVGTCFNVVGELQDY
jgi:hypothetical protein